MFNVTAADSRPTAGLANNIFWVIILTAALDLVGPSIPKASVLLASVVPALGAKAITPYVIYLIPYSARTILLFALSAGGMLAVALSPSGTSAEAISGKMAGIVIGSVASGIGETNFMSLVHFYGPYSLAAWSSGTGGAGLVGAGCYAFATTALGWSVQATLLAGLVFPALTMTSYFLVLPRGVLRVAERARQREVSRRAERDEVDEEDEDVQERDGYEQQTRRDPSRGRLATTESAGLLDRANSRSSPHFSAYADPAAKTSFAHALRLLRIKLAATRSLMLPYMLPLFLVYFAEYTINQGVAPTLLFPLASSPFSHYRAFYPVYGTLYQAGVFISRSSLPFIRVRTLSIPTGLQLLNLALLTAHAMFPFLPSVWIVFIIIIWEGLLGGLVYVSAFADIREEVPAEIREFSLGVAALADSTGILFASLIGMVLETGLCEWQVHHGRDYCMKT